MSYKSYYEETIKNLRNERSKLYRDEDKYSEQDFAQMRKDFYDKFEKITNSREFKIAKSQKIKCKQEQKLYDILCSEVEAKKQELNNINLGENDDELDPEFESLKSKKNKICNAYEKQVKYHKILEQDLKKNEDLLSEKEQELKNIQEEQSNIEKNKDMMSNKFECLQNYKKDLIKYKQEIELNEGKFPNIEKNKADALQKIKELNSGIRQRRLTTIAKALNLKEEDIEIIYADSYSDLDNKELHDMAENLGVGFGDIKTNVDIINTEKDLGKDNLFWSLYEYSVGFDHDILEKTEESQSKVSSVCNDFDESIKEDSINKFLDLRQNYIDCCKEFTKLKNAQKKLLDQMEKIEKNVRNMCKGYVGDTIEIIDNYVSDNVGDTEESFQCRIRTEELKPEIENLKLTIKKQQKNLEEHCNVVFQMSKKRDEILKEYKIKKYEEKTKKEEYFKHKKQDIESKYVEIKKKLDEKGKIVNNQKDLYESDVNISSKDLIRYIKGDIDRTEDELSFIQQYFDSVESWLESGLIAPITIDDLKRKLGLDSSTSFQDLMDKIYGKKGADNVSSSEKIDPVTIVKRKRARIGGKKESEKKQLSIDESLFKLNSIEFKNDYLELSDEDTRFFIRYIRNQESDNSGDTVNYLDTKHWKRILWFYLKTVQESSFGGETEKKNFEKMQQNILGANCPGFFEKISRLSQNKLDVFYDMIKDTGFNYACPLFSSDTLLNLIYSYEHMLGDKKSLIYLLSCNIFSTSNKYGKNELKLLIEKMSVFNCTYNGPTPAIVLDSTRIEQKKTILAGLGYRFSDNDFQKDFDLTAFDYTK